MTPSNPLWKGLDVLTSFLAFLRRLRSICDKKLCDQKIRFFYFYGIAQHTGSYWRVYSAGFSVVCLFLSQCKYKSNFELARWHEMAFESKADIRSFSPRRPPADCQDMKSALPATVIFICLLIYLLWSFQLYTFLLQRVFHCQAGTMQIEGILARFWSGTRVNGRH